MGQTAATSAMFDRATRNTARLCWSNQTNKGSTRQGSMMVSSTLHLTWKFARRIVIVVVGLSVLAIGVALIFLPGPALIVIPVGLAILGAEFTWARAWLHRVRRELSRRALKNVSRNSSRVY